MASLATNQSLILDAGFITNAGWALFDQEMNVVHLSFLTRPIIIAISQRGLAVRWAMWVVVNFPLVNQQ
jgi:hypothetical protein